MLHAALDDGETARRAWQEWREIYPFEKLEPASKRLLPLVYHNLQILGIADALMPQVKQIHRETFRDNQILFREIKRIIEDFESSGIRTLLLKGAALSSRYYASSALRSMSDADLMVEPASVFEARILPKRAVPVSRPSLGQPKSPAKHCQLFAKRSLQNRCLKESAARRTIL